MSSSSPDKLTNLTCVIEIKQNKMSQGLYGATELSDKMGNVSLPQTPIGDTLFKG